MRIIAGAYKGRMLKTTTGPGFRPAMGKVREALFSMLEGRGVIWPHARVLDLFAGSGSLGFEALSRGAALAAFVESAPYAAAVIAKNAEFLGVEEDRTLLWRGDVGGILASRPARPFSVVFLDPPYQERIVGRTIAALMKNGWLTSDAFINAEVEARSSVRAEISGLVLLADRSYGQTRVLLWTADNQTP